jgi:sugar lactone lactonase YvrE/predicted component of type VI protein secretion system
VFIPVPATGRVKPSLLLLIGTVSTLLLPGHVHAFGQAAPQLLPYTITAIAGGAASSPAVGTTCPVSGFTSTDAFGDGCLATEVKLNVPRYVTEDSQGNVFFSDTANALVRRVDAITGVITAVAGGAASNPASGAACGSLTASDANGDGCLATAVKLGLPEGLAFAPNGDLYFADNTDGQVRKVAATNGVIITGTATTGVISNAAGNVATTYGFNVNSAAGTVISATQGYLHFPYGLAFDTQGNLYIADEDNNAIEVVNTTAATTIVTGISIPPGTIAKIAGFGTLDTKSATAANCPNFTAAGASTAGGCYFGSWTDGNPAVTSNLDSVFDVTVDPAGNVYFANEFNTNVGKITTAGIIADYAGIQGTEGTKIVRGPAASTGIGSDFGVTVDQNSNLYVSDGVNALVWRVDAANQEMYVVAGGASTVCASTTDAFGDGCPAAQAKFSIVTLSGGFAKSPGIGGVQGIHVDAAGNLLVADDGNNLIRKISSGTQFGTVNGSKPTQFVDIHFGVGDMPAANAYTLTTGSANFTIVGNATCTNNSDTTEDCVLIVQANPTTPGPFTGTLHVVSTLGKTADFSLTGDYVPVVSASSAQVSVASPGTNCSGNSVSSVTPVTVTAVISPKTGGGIPTGTVMFFANGTQIGATQTLSATGSASISNTFATGTYSVTAVYSGDAFFNPSTSTPQSIVSTSPTFNAATGVQSSTVAAGQSALYSITLNETLFAGNISFSCTGLPAGAACVFSPQTLAGTGCSGSQTEALTITTTQPATTSSLAIGGHGLWAAFGLLPAATLALLITVRRRRSPSWMAGKPGQVWLALALLIALSGAVACNSGTTTTGTPSGTSTVTLTISGGGITNTMPLTLIVK